MEWTTLSSTTILKDRWINLRADECQMPDGNIVAPFYVLQYPHWANALALTADNQVILIQQYRHGLGKTIIELPGGNFDPEE
ncbi:MAG: NUDIX hydrolase, partial [Saprospiraceae bacterium]|nr:NUDIX hydrolase [Saprospiraceae bacterium]